MKIKPLANKVLIRLQKNTTHKIGDKELVIVSQEEKLYRTYVEGIGPTVTIAVQKGDEVILFSNAHLNCHKEFKDMALVNETDIWGVVVTCQEIHCSSGRSGKTLPRPRDLGRLK